ncbi:MAG: glycerophosphodiester phosphodiesterase [Clostridium sp.]|nr:glycerophosphodiester phosphodiesterase [Clostridium sp.]
MYFKTFRYLTIVFIFIFSYNLLEHNILSEEKTYEKRKIFITAHRGSSLKARDNSIEAINMAIEEKADYIEIDVRRTKDNKLVLSHDDIFIKSSGESFSIADSILREINNKGIFSRGNDKNIVTLEKALKLIRGKAKINIDLKVNTDKELLSKLVVELIEKYNMEEDVIITSSNYEAILNVRNYNSDIKIGYITKSLSKDFNIDKIDVISIYYKGLNEDIVKRVHKYNKKIFVWTVNTEEDGKRAISLGVDNIITNDVVTIKKLINNIIQ